MHLDKRIWGGKLVLLKSKGLFQKETEGIKDKTRNLKHTAEGPKKLPKEIYES